MTKLMKISDKLHKKLLDIQKQKEKALGRRVSLGEIADEKFGIDNGDVK